MPNRAGTEGVSSVATARGSSTAGAERQKCLDECRRPQTAWYVRGNDDRFCWYASLTSHRATDAEYDHGDEPFDENDRETRSADDIHPRSG